MSAGGPSSAPRSKGRSSNGRGVHYDEVPLDSHYSENLQSFQNCELALSADPLPPPPLPLAPPFGPEFYPSDSEEPVTALELRPVRRFIPDSWKNFFKGKKDNQWEEPMSDINYISGGVQCSPPQSPSLTSSQKHERSSAVDSKATASSYRDPYGGSGGSYNSKREAEAMLPHDPYDSLDRPAHTVKTYSEKVEEYNLKYSYMKSWPGLLRILCVVELLLGAGVFACVTAYIHKDNEWYNMFGYSQPYGYTASMQGGYYYSGPKTPFVFVVAGVAWVVTIILLVLGMSMYYRTILLDSDWWPLTEFGINICLFILYMAAAIVYVNDTNRGGLCYYQLFNTPINASFCRVEGGQTAAIIFLFVTMLVYLISGIVSLKLWRHEGARRRREFIEQEMKSSQNHSQNHPQKAMHDVAMGSGHVQDGLNQQRNIKMLEMKPELLSGYIPAGHIPKPIVMPDYVAKYQVIKSDDERDRYKAVFNDQFAEYKELSAEVQAVLKKFSDLDAIMCKLPRNPENQHEYERISKVLQEYQKKKNDPTFLEKKERCEYLKNKLSHIKRRIQEYDKVMNWDNGYN
ncbi:MARVEL domain-containing protein 2 [Spea bombifrons]|uniref:MARVEL domain-containing protein 2 n=1 Tax=Spea bombifrons TaxID=233779 RepID=UPI00234A9A84|nr:MARVEL domain-containing protein 2 [Spea bombifrons]XP_053331354.1 MARVEL domain-containing protein 2 [Spea bombifrons]